MKTVVTKSPKVAAAAIRRGQLAAFPTETVYGLGANAFDARAVRRIFRAKRRPPDNPLIVHIHSKAQLAQVAAPLGAKARRLVAAFFPGPLTLVLEKSPKIPAVVTAGLPTVCVRMPSLPLARRFLRLCGVPLAAPSANISGRPSPTGHAHALSDLSGRISVVLAGPAAEYGVESTIVDCTTEPPTLLRPGSIPLEDIESVVGAIRLPGRHSKSKSPGLRHRHYAPKAKVVIVSRPSRLPQKPGAWAFIGFAENRNARLCLRVRDSTHYARELYSFFRRADELGLRKVYAQMPPAKGIGLAVRDRIARAAAR